MSYHVASSSIIFLKHDLEHLILFHLEVVALSSSAEGTITVLPSHIFLALPIVTPGKVAQRFTVIIAFISYSQVIVPAEQRPPLTIAPDQIPIFLRQHLLEQIQLKQEGFPLWVTHVLAILD